MTKIFCSNKLKDFLGQKYFSPIEDLSNIYGDWNAHLFYFDRRKNLIIINNKSLYCIIIPDIKKADLANFSTLFFNRLTEQLIHDKVIDPSNILLTIQKFTPLLFTKTNNDKKTIGTINEFIYTFEFSKFHPEWQEQNILEINSYINNSLVGASRAKKGDYGRPIEDMRTLLNTSA